MTRPSPFRLFMLLPLLTSMPTCCMNNKAAQCQPKHWEYEVPPPAPSAPVETDKPPYGTPVYKSVPNQGSQIKA